MKKTAFVAFMTSFLAFFGLFYSLKGWVLWKKVSFATDASIQYENFQFLCVKFDFCGLHSALDFIPCYPSLRSVPLGMKSPALFRPQKWKFYTSKKIIILSAARCCEKYNLFILMYLLYSKWTRLWLWLLQNVIPI